MYTRVSTIQGPTDRIDEGIDTMREIILPAVKQIDGFKGVLNLIDRQTGRGLVVTLWETEEALKTSEEQANQLRRQAAESIGATSEPTVERYEVAMYEVEAPITV